MTASLGGFNRSTVGGAFIKSPVGGAYGIGFDPKWYHDGTLPAAVACFDMDGHSDGFLYLYAELVGTDWRIYKRTAIGTYVTFVTGLDSDESNTPQIKSWDSKLFACSRHGVGGVWDISSGVPSNVIAMGGGNWPLCHNPTDLFWMGPTPGELGPFDECRRYNGGAWTPGVSTHSMSGGAKISGYLDNYILQLARHWTGTTQITRANNLGVAPVNPLQIGSDGAVVKSFNGSKVLFEMSDFGVGWSSGTPAELAAESVAFTATHYEEGIWFAAGIRSVVGDDYQTIWEKEGAGDWIKTYDQIETELTSIGGSWFARSGNFLFLTNGGREIFRRQIA